MKPTNVINVQRHGDFGGQKIAMGIDENSLAHIMSVLTDLYSNTVRAVVREYSTNARDSHIDAGTTRPIEVTLPTAMSPFFKVRDFGLGLSVDDIYKVYSQYGASTKRDRDTVNGMLGLGCKSALTYATSFTVVSTHDSVKITVVVSRSEDGSASMEVVDTVSTTEGNGVEITVPVKQGDIAAFRTETYNFFQYWDEGTVLVNGEAPARIHGSLKMVTPEIGMLSGSGDDVVVFGGVAYPVKEPGLYAGNRPYSNPFRLVAFLDASDDEHKVVFTPNREALTYSGLTVPTLARLRQSFTDSIKATIQADVDSQPTHHEAMGALMSWAERFGGAMVEGVTYKGEAFPQSFDLIALTYSTSWNRRQVDAYAYNAGQSKKYGHDVLRKAIVFTGYDGVQINSTYKKKISEFKSAMGLSGNSHFICADASHLAPWIKVYDWTQVKAVRLGSGPASGPRGPVKMPVYDPATGYTTTSIALDNNKTLLYVSPRYKMSTRTVVALYKAFPNIQIFCLGENRWDKFKRENPKSESLHVWVKRQVQDARDALTKDDMLIIRMTRYSYTKYTGFDLTRFNDPDLARYLGILAGKVTSPRVNTYKSVRDAAQSIGHYEPDLPAVDNNVLAGYPLISDQSDKAGREHVYFYANAVYAARQNGTL